MLKTVVSWSSVATDDTTDDMWRHNWRHVTTQLTTSDDTTDDRWRYNWRQLMPTDDRWRHNWRQVMTQQTTSDDTKWFSQTLSTSVIFSYFSHIYEKTKIQNFPALRAGFWWKSHFCICIFSPPRGKIQNRFLKIDLARRRRKIWVIYSYNINFPYYFNVFRTFLSQFSYIYDFSHDFHI